MQNWHGDSNKRLESAGAWLECFSTCKTLSWWVSKNMNFHVWVIWIEFPILDYRIKKRMMLRCQLEHKTGESKHVQRLKRGGQEFFYFLTAQSKPTFSPSVQLLARAHAACNVSSFEKNPHFPWIPGTLCSSTSGTQNKEEWDPLFLPPSISSLPLKECHQPPNKWVAGVHTGIS